MIYILIAVCVALVVGIWAINKYLFKAPTARQVANTKREGVVKEPSVVPVSMFIPPAKHLHTWQPITDMNNQTKMFKCAGCNLTKDA